MILRSLAFLLFLLTASAGLHAAEPLVRVEILTQPPIAAGQQVQVQVDVLAPNFFLSPPKFPLFDLPNAIVTLPDTGAQNLVETIEGQSYAGIRRTYIVTPQTGGDFTLPPAKITFIYAAVPGQPGSEGSVTLPPQKFRVAGAPPGTPATAQRITVTQKLDRDPENLKGGDTLVRTVTVEALGMQAMMIPVPEFTAPEGVRLYPHDPVLSDKMDQGQGSIGGTRVDRVTYEFEKAGSYRLPAIEISWYDPATQKNEVAEAPEVTVSVAATAGFTPAIKPPEITEEAPKRPDYLRLLPWAAGLAALAFLAWLVPALWRGLRQWRQACRQRYEQSEAYSFRQFSSACRSGEGAPVYAALQSWADRAKTAPLREWLSRGGDSAALAQYERLEARLFAATAATGSYDASELLAGIAQARNKWLARRTERLRPAALPPLNP
ncbi:BatD family protein [Taklimakanibacter deserti]|uniref:BatD family protein n=1 Tax=Taklimakanibacter deserti TaxID=2267839 RepID=UPI000E654669